jgi:hypothetical protein
MLHSTFLEALEFYAISNDKSAVFCELDLAKKGVNQPGTTSLK